MNPDAYMAGYTAKTTEPKPKKRKKPREDRLLTLRKKLKRNMQ